MVRPFQINVCLGDVTDTVSLPKGANVGRLLSNYANGSKLTAIVNNKTVGEGFTLKANDEVLLVEALPDAG